MSEKPQDREGLLGELVEEMRRSAAGGVFFLRAVAERSGMNLTDLQCVNILASTGPITAGRLAEEMGLTTGSVTGLIDRMERAGYVRREKDPADGRRVVVRPVSEVLERADPFGATEGEVVELLSDYGDRDLAVILDFTRRTNAISERETARIRGASGGGEGGEFSAPLRSAERGRLVFMGGASRLTLRAASSGTGDLYRARFEGTPPKVGVEGGTVTFRRPRRFTLFDLRRHSEEVALSASVPWEIEVRGGAAGTRADLGGLRLVSFVLKGGVSDLELTLPEPSGVVPIRLSGGARKVDVRRPAGVDARIVLEGGAAKLAFDGQSLASVGGTVRLKSPGYAAATDCYEIEITGGAKEVVVTTAG